jgi:hypothetical protein
VVFVRLRCYSNVALRPVVCSCLLAHSLLAKMTIQISAIDVWSAGVILLFFITRKFPIFQSNDDIEGLMEIAVIIGKKQMERTATLHSKFSLSLYNGC